MKKKETWRVEEDEQNEVQPQNQTGLEGTVEHVKDTLQVEEATEAEFESEEIAIEDELSSLQSELDDIRSKAEEYLDGWQRARAEFANYKKRIEKEREDTRTFITANILSKYLTVADDLERALNDRPTDEAARAWSEGIDMIYRKLKSILEAEGVEEIIAEGEPFDPNYHEAIGFEESEDHNEGEIVEVVQRGYKIGNRVIRPATVKVAK